MTDLDPVPLGHFPDPIQDYLQDDIVDDQQGIGDVDAVVDDDENDQHQPPIALPTGPLRRPTRDRRSNAKYTSEEYVLLIDRGEPECYDEAMESECKDNWVEAMKDELRSLYDNLTFELVKLPKGKRALKNRWVYTLKHEEKSATPRYKARFVVKSYCQKKRFDFEEIFSPVDLARFRDFF